MAVSRADLERLRNIILRKLQEEFKVKHLSGNLINTIQLIETETEIKIHIPAKTYDMLLFQNQGVVVHTSNGSYAERLNEEGSSFMVYPKGTKKSGYRIYPRNHKGYIDRIIKEAVQEWTSAVGYKIEKVEDKNE